MKPWQLLTTPPAHGAWNMAIDESILEYIGRGESFPTLRLYAWTPACLSLGHAQPFADVDWRVSKDAAGKLSAAPPVARAILHTDELTYSVTGSAERTLIDRRRAGKLQPNRTGFTFRSQKFGSPG